MCKAQPTGPKGLGAGIIEIGNIHVGGAATFGWVEWRGEMLGEVLECSVDPHSRSARGERRGRKENRLNTSIILVENSRRVIRLKCDLSTQGK